MSHFEGRSNPGFGYGYMDRFASSRGRDSVIPELRDSSGEEGAISGIQEYYYAKRTESCLYFGQQKYAKLLKANKLAVHFCNRKTVFMTLRQYLLPDSRFGIFMRNR